MAFTPNDVIATARDLLQDTVNGPYRFSTDSLIRAFNMAIPEARRIRPDLFFASLDTLPVVTTGNLATPLALNDQYKTAFVMFLVGFAELRIDQFTNDNRAMTMMARFSSMLTGPM